MTPQGRKASVTPFGACFAIAALAALLVRYQSIPFVVGGGLEDPDSYMLLARMQEALDHGHWLGSGVARDASGAGMVLPWAHVLDTIILLLRAPLRLILTPGPALFWAGVATAPIFMGLLGMLCAWAAAPLASRGWLWTAAVGVAVAPATLNYGQIGFVSHHMLVVACVVATIGAAGRAAFGDVLAGCLTGLFMGAGIWVSPEVTPFDVMALGAVFLSWAVRPAPQVASALVAAGGALLAVVAAAFVIDTPPAGPDVAELDRISLTFLCLAAIIYVLCRLPRLMASAPVALRFAGLGVAGAAGGGFWLTAFPGYLHGLAGLMSPEEAAAFFSHIQEMAPLNTPGPFALFGLAGSLAVLACFALAAAGVGGWLGRVLWLYAGVCGALCLALAVMHQRFSAYPATFAAMLLPALLTMVSRPALLPWRPVLRPALCAAFLCAPGFLGRLLVTPAQAEQWAGIGAYEATCRVRDAIDALAPYAGAVVLANVDDGPELLYRTRAKIVGSLYHTGVPGFMRLRAAWRARDLAAPPPELFATGADYILICPHQVRMGLVDGPADTLFDRLNAGDPPPWLRAVTQEGTGSPWVLYAIARDG